MRTFLKVAAVLMLSFGGYYLLMGLSALMASGQIGQVAQSMDETIDPALASQATVQLGLMMLSIGVLEGLGRPVRPVGRKTPETADCLPGHFRGDAGGKPGDAGHHAL